MIPRETLAQIHAFQEAGGAVAAWIDETVLTIRSQRNDQGPCTHVSTGEAVVDAAAYELLTRGRDPVLALGWRLEMMKDDGTEGFWQDQEGAYHLNPKFEDLVGRILTPAEQRRFRAQISTRGLAGTSGFGDGLLRYASVDAPRNDLHNMLHLYRESFRAVKEMRSDDTLIQDEISSQVRRMECVRESPVYREAMSVLFR